MYLSPGFGVQCVPVVGPDVASEVTAGALTTTDVMVLHSQDGYSIRYRQHTADGRNAA